MAWVEYDYESGEALADALAGALFAATRAAIATQGHAWLALAGGRTPWPAYRRFVAMPLEWSKVSLVPTDERCVPHDHAACNVRELRDVFAPAKGVRVESLTTSDGDPVRSETHARALLARRSDPFDTVVLGMGQDAHTASLFPGAAQLAAALDPADKQGAHRIDPDPLPPEAPFPRITLSLPRLLQARSLHLALSGEPKRAILRRAQAGGRDVRLPISEVLHAPGMTVDVHWSP